MKIRSIPHIDTSKYKPLPISIFNEDYDTLESRMMQVIFDELNEVERNLIIASVELDTQNELAHVLNVSHSTISVKLKAIRSKIKRLVKEKYRL